MILIADSGSTKTDWAVVPNSQFSTLNSQLSTLKSQGLNPYHQSPEAISRILHEELLPQMDSTEVDCIYFYGSGVSADKEPLMQELLRQAFPQATVVEAHSDMLGAAHALCGGSEGIACILGTGANSCLFDGQRIVRQTPALGYILGDEGSGAVLGRLFINALYKGGLSEKIKADFEHATGLTMATVIERVYRQPMANRFLASLYGFIHAHINDEEGLRELVIANFESFLSRNIAPYGHRDLPVSFVGSIAHYYEPQLREAATRQRFTVGAVLRSPLPELVAYHRHIGDRTL